MPLTEFLAVTTATSSASAPVLIAVVSAIGGIAATIVTQLFLKTKTTAEASKTTKEGDSALMESASTFVAQTGEFGARLMERIAMLEDAVSSRDERINRLEGELHDLKVEVAKHEATREVLGDLRTELARARERAESAERDAAKLEAIIVAAQMPIGGDAEEDAAIMERHDHLKKVALEYRDQQTGNDKHAGDGTKSV